MQKNNNNKKKKQFKRQMKMPLTVHTSILRAWPVTVR